jgi:hypothetical protein
MKAPSYLEAVVTGARIPHRHGGIARRRQQSRSVGGEDDTLRTPADVAEGGQQVAGVGRPDPNFSRSILGFQRGGHERAVRAVGDLGDEARVAREPVPPLDRVRVP